MALDWSPLVETVQRCQHWLLTTHIRPDGDGLGSMIALADVLEARGKQVDLVIGSTFPPRYRFLDPKGRIQQFGPQSSLRETIKRADALLILDTGTWNQLGDMGPFLRQTSAARLVIDHHPTQDDLGAVRLVDTTAEATGRLAYEAIRALGDPISPTAARALFVALAMDTGWFRHSNTTPDTFELAAELTRLGSRPDVLYDQLYEQSTLPRLKLTGLVLERLNTACDGRVAYSEIHRSDYARTGATPQDTEDLVNFTRGLAGVEVGLFFMEQPRGGVKVSFRSRSGVDVGKVAESFGGGGHRLASGAILETNLEDARTRVLEAIRAVLDPTP